MKGNGTAYNCYASSLAIVELDCLTGEHCLERVEIVFDAGEMINVGIELGQIEGNRRNTTRSILELEMATSGALESQLTIILRCIYNECWMAQDRTIKLV